MWKKAQLAADTIDTALSNRYKSNQLSSIQADVLHQAWVFQIAAKTIENLDFPRIDFSQPQTTALLESTAYLGAFQTRLADYRMFTIDGIDPDSIAKIGSARVVRLVLAVLWDCGMAVPSKLMKTWFPMENGDTVKKFLKRVFRDGETHHQILSYQNLVKVHGVFRQAAQAAFAASSSLSSSSSVSSAPEGAPTWQAQQFSERTPGCGSKKTSWSPWARPSNGCSRRMTLF